MQGCIILALLGATLSSASYHVLVADGNGRGSHDDESSNLLSSHLRQRRSLTDPDIILASMTGDQGSGAEELGQVQQFQFFMKNNDTEQSAKVSITELMPGNAILMDFSIHNHGKTYTYDQRNARSVEEATVEYQHYVANDLTAVVLGDVKTYQDRCSDCRSDESITPETIGATINIAPGDTISVSLSYMVPSPDGLTDHEKVIYRTDTTIDLDASAQNFTGVIMSPNYPDNYPNSADLTWLIQAPVIDMILSASLVSFHSEECCDHLYIYDGPTDSNTLLYELSGDATAPVTLYTTRPNMLVKFQSDYSVTDGGFALEFHPTTREVLIEDQNDENKVSNGTIVLMDNSGELNTPNYPKFYPASAVIDWDIIVQEGYTIDLRIIDFDVFYGETLEVTDLNSGEIFATLDYTTGDITPYNINVSSNEISLVFKSNDKVIQKRGVYAQYFSRRAKDIRLPSYDTDWHTITSPHFPHQYSSNEYLVWSISAGDEAYDIRIEIVTLSLEHGYDFLYIYQGAAIVDTNRIATLSGIDGVDVEHIVFGNLATIVFETDQSITNTGFELRYRNFITYTNCTSSTEIIYGGPSGAIRNANYPSNTYTANECNWLITVSDTKVITAFLQEFSGSYSTLTFYDGSSKSDPVIYSSSSSRDMDDAATAISTSNEMLVIISRTSASNTRYSLRFQEAEDQNLPTCKDPVPLYTTTPGQIVSANYPLYAPYGQCRWLVEAPTGYQVRVTFDQTYVRYSNYVYLYNGNSTDSIIATCSSCSNGYSVTSSSDTMLIVSYATSSMRFKLQYEFVAGSTYLLNRETGSALSPSYPAAYPNNAYETTVIEVSSGGVIFYLGMFETEACCDYLSIYDGDSDLAPLMYRLSGNHDGLKAQSTGRFLTLKFESDSSIIGAGFRLDYCASSGNCEFLDETNSAYNYHLVPQSDTWYVVGSPSSSGYYLDDVDFYWYIECPRSGAYRIIYDFRRLDIDGSDKVKVYNGMIVDDDSVSLTISGYNYYYTGLRHYGAGTSNLVWFHSDTAISGLGFYMYYYCDS